MNLSPGRAADRLPVPALFIGSGMTQYVGAALAVGLFAQVTAAGVAWLRIAIAALILLAWRRPWRHRWTRRDVGVIALFGVTLATMNISFYLAIEHLPLGTAVAIEFIGPVAVAAVTGAGWRERGGIVLAAAGVVLLAGVSVRVGGPGATIGLAWVLVAAACWAGYILLGRRIAIAGDGVTSLAWAMTAGALVFAPVLGRYGAPVLSSWSLALAVLGVAVMSSIVPYALEQVILRRVSAATFAVLLALLPATAAASGALVLRQWPGPLDVVGLLLVSGAIALTSARRRPKAPPLPAG